jgi:PAS domain-containing protein
MARNYSIQELENSLKLARRQRFHIVFLVLAFLNFITIATGLYVNDQLMGIYTNYTVESEDWSARLSRMAELRQLVAAVNAPANDIFDSWAIDAETRRLNDAMSHLKLYMSGLRREFSSSANAKQGSGFTHSLDNIESLSQTMYEEGKSVLSIFAQGNFEDAAARMAAMDRTLGKINREITILALQMRDVQQENFAIQFRYAESLADLESYIVILICILVGFAAVYGGQLSRYASRHVLELERYLRALKGSEDRFKTLSQHVPGIIFQYLLDKNGEGRFLFLSASSKTLLSLMTVLILKTFPNFKLVFHYLQRA